MQNVPPIREVEIDNLKPPLWRLRKISQQTVTELMQSIQNQGLLEPILVQRDNEGYRVIFGAHRLEACRGLGMKTIQATVTDMTDEEAFLALVTENLVRNIHINPVEEARGYKMLIKKGWTISSISRRVGKCDSYICERIGMVDRLGVDVCQRIASKNTYLTPSHAELLSRISDKHKQNDLVKLVEERRLNVRELENLLKAIPIPTKVVARFISGSYWIRIPRDFVKSLKLSTGELLHMYMCGESIVIRRTRPRKNKFSQVFRHRSFLPLKLG